MSAQKLWCVVIFQKRVLRAFGLHLGPNQCRNTVWWFRQNFRILSPGHSDFWQIEILKSATTITKTTRLSLQSPKSVYPCLSHLQKNSRICTDQAEVLRAHWKLMKKGNLLLLKPDGWSQMKYFSIFFNMLNMQISKLNMSTLRRSKVIKAHWKKALTIGVIQAKWCYDFIIYLIWFTSVHGS